ncbi:outer membrane beta-barrel protein [Thermodesulfobacteriota bacterium]
MAKMINKNRYIDRICAAGTICLALIFFTCAAFAGDGNIRVGSLKITPGIKYKGSYQKNIFYEPTDERDDYIHTFTPNILFEYAGGTLGNYLKAGYDLDLAAYMDYEDNNYQTHRPWISLSVDNLGPFYLKADEKYVYTTDPYGTANTYNLGTKTTRWTNDVDIALGYRFADKYALELGYRNYVEQFKENKDQFQDRIDHRISATFFVKVASKTLLFGQYRRTDADYDEQNEGNIQVAGFFPPIVFWNAENSQDYTLDDYFVGARFHPTGRLSGEIKIGYGQKTYKNSFNPYGTPYEDEDTLIAETNVRYVIKKNASVSVNFYRTFLGSPDLVTPVSPTGYEDTKIGIAYTHNLNRTTFRAGFDYNLQNYKNEMPGFPNKYFQVYTVRAELDYRVNKWLTAGLDYKHEDKDASDAVYEATEYSDNVISFSGDVVF